ncbi:MAG: hypothetical protein RMK29_04300 [Myxococcales bacterium]|nr:hypothetical protein [Myxococcota bacterium]MDW8280909.1 hypothetical protein [Myxococcales bacterium]
MALQSQDGRDPALWPFSSESPWNLPLGRGARYAPPDDPCTRDLIDPSIPAWINAAEWSMPVYVANEADRPVPIVRDGVQVTSLRIPQGARPSGPEGQDSDAHLLVVTPDRRFVDELWRARPRPNGGWDVASWSRNDLYGMGIGRGGERAYGGSALGGLIRRHELASGIPHALALAIPRHRQRRGFVWPASGEDDGAADSYRGHVPMGQLVAIPPEVNLAALPLSSAGRRIGEALQRYGAYDVDSAASFTLFAEPQLEGELADARSDLLLLRPWMRCVSNNSENNPGGGGEPLAPRAPPLLPWTRFARQQ